MTILFGTRVHSPTTKLAPRNILRAFLIYVLCAFPVAASADPVYPWRTGDLTKADRLEDRFQPPPGFTRSATPPGSFGQWLRQLPLKPRGHSVHLYDGRLKLNQSAHAGVIDIDVGNRDLQQCADAVMRLRAEYLYGQNRFGDIQFNFTDGTPVAFSRWQRGDRPRMSGRKTRWRRVS